jgi:exopolyphosphatase / guanosine-5'-triphosphate,3'-diphosphate pyrophosphatase
VKSAPTSPERVASIDIGTNTILLLIAEVRRGKLKTLFDTETIVRLGEGVQKNGILSEGAMKRGFQTLKGYLKRCQEMEVQKIFAVGTSALREARDSAQFLTMVKEKLHLSIEVISGEEEASLSFLAVARDLKEAEKSILVVDVGGGSTELVQGKGDAILQWVSLPLGIVRFNEKFLLSDPVKEEEWKAMAEEIRKQLSGFPFPKEPLSMISIGGTGTALVSVELGLEKFIPEKIHRFILPREALRNQLFLYRSKTLEEREKIKGLPSARADVILAGGTILYLIMEGAGCSSFMVSTHGVRYGLLYKRLTL